MSKKEPSKEGWAGKAALRGGSFALSTSSPAPDWGCPRLSPQACSPSPCLPCCAWGLLPGGTLSPCNHCSPQQPPRRQHSRCSMDVFKWSSLPCALRRRAASASGLDTISLQLPGRLRCGSQGTDCHVSVRSRSGSTALSGLGRPSVTRPSGFHDNSSCVQRATC